MSAVFVGMLLATTLQAQITGADLTVSKTGPSTATANSNVTFNIAITNLGPDDAANATMTDNIPGSSWTFVSVTPDAPFTCSDPGPGNSGLVSCSAQTFTAGATANITLVLHIPTGTADGTQFTNVANVNADNDPNSENNTSSALVTVGSTTAADVAVNKSGPQFAAPGSQVTFTITVSNLGPNDATTVVLNDTPGAGLTGGTITQTSGPTFSCPGNVTPCSISKLTNGSTATFQFVVTVSSSAGTYDNIAKVTSDHDPNPENNSSVASVTVASADVGVVKSAPPAAVAGGPTFDYVITLSNSGPDEATNPFFNDALPAGITFVSVQQNSGPAGACSNTTTSVNCGVPTLLNGQSASFTVTVKANSNVANGTVVTNTAVAGSSTTDTNPNNDSSSAMTTISATADVAIVKTGPASVTAGNSISYSITVTNNGPSDASSVSWVDPLPAGTTFVSENQNSGPAFNCITGATVTCSIATLTAGATATFTINATVSPSAPAGTLSNTATVTATTPDTSSGNNSSNVQTTVAVSADVAIVKTGPAAASAGSNVSYSITVTNNGPSTAASVSWTDVLPAGTTFVSENQNNGPAFNCITGATVTCSIATLAPAASANFTLVVHVAGATPNGTVITNTANVTSTTPDPTPGNNTSPAQTTVGTNADLAVTKTGPSATPSNTTVAYTVTVSNNGPSDAGTVTLTDVVPAGTTFASETQNSGPAFNCITPAAGATGTITCTIATFTAGSTASFQFTFNVPPNAVNGSTISNTATVSSTTLDPNPANNTATANTTVGASIPALSPLMLLLLAFAVSALALGALRR